jgi:hypothetical protein
MSKKEVHYVLTLTSTQAHVLLGALDFYSRIGIGQLEELLRVLPTYGQLSEVQQGVAYEAVRKLKQLLTGFDMNASWGIASREVKECYKIVYDIQQVLRNKVAWTELPKGGSTWAVNFDKPSPVSLEPLSHCEAKPQEVTTGATEGTDDNATKT